MDKISEYLKSNDLVIISNGKPMSQNKHDIIMDALKTIIDKTDFELLITGFNVDGRLNDK